MTALIEQIRQMAYGGMDPEDIAETTKMDLGLIKVALGESVIPKEDITEEDMSLIKEGIMGIATNPGERTADRLNALKFLWQEKRGRTGVPSNVGQINLITLNQQVNHAKERTNKYVEQFTTVESK